MKRNEIKNLVRKAIIEVISEAPETAPPPTKPVSPPKPATPRPSKPHPLQPTRPDIKPRPKAISHDIQAFINVRKGMKEAIDTTGYPDFIDPEKRASYENEKDYVEQILPDLGPQADRYLEIITSESYKHIVNKAARYLGKTVDQVGQMFPNFPTLMGLLMMTDQEVMRMESRVRPQLERLATELVLGMTEYQMFNKLVQNGQIKLDIRLDSADLSNAVAEDEMDEITTNGLTVAENLNAQLAAGFQGDTEGKLRRMFANFITQGDAVNKFWSFNEVNDQLRQINPRLPEKYGLLAACSSIFYYYSPKIPLTRMFMDMAGKGSEEVSPNEDGTYTIKVRGGNFILMIHELVKGFNDYLSMDIASQEELDTETLPDEDKQIMSGPALDLKIRSLLPAEKLQLLPLIKKLLYRLPIPQIKELLLGGNRASNIMRRLIQTAEQQMNDFENPPDEPSEPDDSGDTWKL